MGLTLTFFFFNFKGNIQLHSLCKIQITHGKIWNVLFTCPSIPIFLSNSVTAVYRRVWEVVLVTQGNPRGLWRIIVFWFLIWVFGNPEISSFVKIHQAIHLWFVYFVYVHNIPIKSLSKKMSLYKHTVWLVISGPLFWRTLGKAL